MITHLFFFFLQAYRHLLQNVPHESGWFIDWGKKRRFNFWMFEACFKDSNTNILIIVSIYGRAACTSNCASSPCPPQFVTPSSALPMQQVPKVQDLSNKRDMCCWRWGGVGWGGYLSPLSIKGKQCDRADVKVSQTLLR